MNRLVFLVKPLPLFYHFIYVLNFRGLLAYCSFNFAEEDLLQAQQNFEKVTSERNALEGKVDDLKDVVVEKSQTIDNLKNELNEVHEKDLKICHLEMDIDVLQG